MSSYRYTEYGAPYPSQGGYHDNTGYYGSSKDLSRLSQKGSHVGPPPGSFEPVRMYPSQMTRSAGPEKFNWHMLRTAVAATIFCPCFCGLFGLVYALLSYTDFHKGEIASYHHKKSCAIGWSVTGIVIAVLYIIAAIGVLIWVYSTVLTAIALG